MQGRHHGSELRVSVAYRPDLKNVHDLLNKYLVIIFKFRVQAVLNLFNVHVIQLRSHLSTVEITELTPTPMSVDQ